MYPCHCCKSAHRDLPLLSTWGPSESDEEILDETILSELGEISLDWFDKLTEDYLVQHSNDSHSLLTSSPNVSEGWSPCPKGGFCYLPGKKNLSVDVTPLTALFSSPRNSQKDSQLRARIQAIPDSIVPLQPELNWTSSMATPTQKCLGDSENKENLPEEEQLKERKVIHRQLFSPSGSSFCDDSFSLVGDNWPEGDLTVETEKTVISEKELSFGSDRTLCELNNQVASLTSPDLVDNCDVTSDTYCDNMNECDKRRYREIPAVSSHDRHMHPTASNTLLMESVDKKCNHGSCPKATLSHNISSDSCETKIHFSDSMNDQCYLGLFQDSSFDSMQERTTDVDVSVISCESANKSKRMKVATDQQKDMSEKMNNRGNTDSSHIEKVLSKVFVSQESVENVTKEPGQSDEYQCNVFNSLEIIAPNFDPDYSMSRKRQTFETAPQAKRQKVETPSKKSKEGVSMEDGHLSCETPRRLEEHLCNESFLDENKQDSPEPAKKTNVTISILKNPLTPKSTNKKKVQFNLDSSSVQKSCVDRPAADYVDTSKLQAISTDTVSHLIEASTSDLSKSASELAMYFFKDSDSSADDRTCQESPCHDVGHGQENHYELDMKPCKAEFVTDTTMSKKSDTEDHQTTNQLNLTKDSKLLLPLKVDTDLLDEYCFDSSFEVSPTFCSQVGQTKNSETRDDPSATGIVELNAETDSVSDEMDTANHNEKPGLSSELLYVTLKNEAKNHLFVKSQVSNFAGFDSDNVCATVSNVEKEMDLEDPLYETNVKMKCDTTNRSEMVVVTSTDFQPTSLRTETVPETSQERTCKSTISRDSPLQSQGLQLSTSKTSSKPEGKHLSKKPRRFLYPSADQIASIGPESAVTEDITFKPTAGFANYPPKADLNLPTHNTSVCPPNLDTHQLLQSTKNESVINATKGYENQDKPVMSASSSLGFSTFSEVYSKANDELSHTMDMPGNSESTQVVIQQSHTMLDLQTSVIVNESLTSSSSSNQPRHDVRFSTDATDSAKSQSCLVKSTQLCHTAVVLHTSLQDSPSESYSVSLGCQTPELADTLAQSFTSDVPYTPTLNTYSSNISPHLLLTREDAESVIGKSCTETDLTFTSHPEISHEKDSYCDETMTSQIWTATEFTQILDSSNLQEITNDNNTSGQNHSDLTTLHPTGKEYHMLLSHDNETYENKKIDMLDSSCHSDRLAAVMQTETKSPYDAPNKSSYASDEEINSRLLSGATELMKESKSDADTTEDTETCSTKLKDVIKESECKDNQICKGFTVASGQLFSTSELSNSKSNLVSKPDCFLSSNKRKIDCQKQLPCAGTKADVDQQSVMIVPPGSGVCRNSSFTVPSITTTALCGSKDNFFDQRICNNEKHNTTESKHFTVSNKDEEKSISNVMFGNVSPVTTKHSSPGQLNCSVKFDDMSDASVCSASSFTMAGFSTAGGKEIKLSELAKNKAKKLWDSIVMDSDHNGPLTSDHHGPVTSDQEKDFLQESNSTDLKCVGLTETKTSSHDSSIDLKPKGFRPFKPPAIKRKSESYTKSQTEISRNVTDLHKQKIDEWDDDSCLRDVIINETNIPTVPAACMTYPDKQTHASVAPEVSDFDQVSKNVVATAGFATASGKTMSVSDQGLLSAKKLWQDLDADVFEMTSEPCVKHTEFGFSLTDSDHTAHKTPEVHNKLSPMVKASVTKRDNGAVNKNLSHKQGFLLSSTVEAKEEAIQKKSVRNLHDNTHKHSPSTKKEWSPNEDINLVSDFSFENCATAMSYCDPVSTGSSDSTKHNAVKLSCSGGNSALIKPLIEYQDLVSKTVSNSALSETPGYNSVKQKHLPETKANSDVAFVSNRTLNHDNKFTAMSTTLPSVTNTISKLDLLVTALPELQELTHSTASHIKLDWSEIPKLHTSGFTTASGSKVTVSEAALRQAQTFLEDNASSSFRDLPTDNEQDKITKPNNGTACDFTQVNKNVSRFPGFSTASGTSVNVSDKALLHAKTFLEESDEVVDMHKDVSMKKLAPVIKARDHAHSLLNDTSKNAISNTTPKNDIGTISAGFSTASGAKVSVSKKALDHAHSLLNDTSKDEVSNTTPKNDIGTITAGFSTASGAKVSVSKKALDHVQNMLEDTYNEIDLSTDIAHQSTVSPFFVSVGPSKPFNDQVDVLKGDFKTVTDSKTPVTDRLKAIVKVKEDGPNNFSLTPVSATYEEFHYDRPVTRSGKRLYPVRPRSLTSEFCPSPVIQSTKPSSCFKPPSKKVKLSCENDQRVPSPTLGMGQKCETVRSSFVPPAYTPSSVAASAKVASTPELATAAVPSRTGDGNQCVKKTAHAPKVKDSVDLEDDLENLLLCQDFQSLSPTASTKCPKDTTHSLSNESCTLMTCASEKHVPDISDLKSKNKMSIICEDVLEEERMKQEKIIRYKKRTQVRPLCGHWMKSRKQKGSLQKLSDLEPSVGLTREQLMSLGVSASTLDINSLNAREFRFDLRRFHPALNAAVLIGDGALLVPDRCGYAGVEEFVRAFLTLDSVDASLVDDNWIGNHYRWIVWKLAAYEVNFSQHLAGRSLTPDNAMFQLKYRYDREVDACERSALKKILERDDTASKRMVLCVASIVCKSDGQYCVELSDGWYAVRGQLDQRLTDLISRKKIITGDKIITSGAELFGGQEACSPLEIKEDIALKLHGNATRPAPWHARLGFCCPPSPLCVSIKSLCPDGGHVGAVDVVLARIYPVMYMEKLKDGGCVFHTAEEEDKLRQKHEDQREAEMEKVYSSLQKERKVNCMGKKQHLKKLSRKEIEALWDGQEIAHALENAFNSEEIQQLLSSSQRNRLMEYRQRETDRHQEEIKKRLMEAMAQTTVRNVTPVLKLKVNGVSAVDIDDSVSCLVTVWRPGSEWTSMEEGRRYKLYNMAVSGVRGRNGAGKISLTATRQSRLQLCSINDNLLDMVYEPRQAWSVSELTSTVPMGNEFDFVGVVVQLIPSSRMSQPTLLYAADQNGEFLCIKLWSSSQTSSLKCPQVFVAYNLVLSTSSHNSSGQSLLTADTRSDLTTITTNGHSSRYSEGFTQMQMLCKCPDFVIGVKSELEHCLSSHQPKTVTKALPDKAEDFPLDIVDKIFSPMSQVGGWSSNSKSSSTAIKSVSVSINNAEKQRGYTSHPTSSNSFQASADASSCSDNSLQCSSLDKRKQMLRDKMAKLLAYDQPAPLERLPLGGSPACKKEFKSPSTKKTS